jgi:hypothetical protein
MYAVALGAKSKSCLSNTSQLGRARLIQGLALGPRSPVGLTESCETDRNVGYDLQLSGHHDIGR